MYTEYDRNPSFIIKKRTSLKPYDEYSLMEVIDFLFTTTGSFKSITGLQFWIKDEV